MRVIQRRGGPRFANQARPCRLIVKIGWRQYLEGDVALELRIAGAIHLAHATGAELADDFVARELLSWSERFAMVVERRTAGSAGQFSGSKQRFDLAPQIVVVAACVAKISVSRRRRLRQHVVKQGGDVLPAIHRDPRMVRANAAAIL